MITGARIALNDIQLDEVDKNILITSITENAGSINISTAQHGAYSQRIMSTKTEPYELSVSFKIHLIDLSERIKALNSVRAWAKNGGSVTVDYRTRQKLDVVCTELPSANRVTDPYAVLTVKFAAFTVPYWVSSKTITGSVEGSVSSVSAVLNVQGNMKTPLSFTVQNASDNKVNTIIVASGSDSIEFNNLGLSKGEKISLYYSSDIQYIKKIDNDNKKTSILANRTVQSSDVIYVDAGKSIVKCSADQKCKWSFKTVGRYI